MSTHAKAWFLHAGDGAAPERASLVLEEIELPAPGEGEVLAEPLFGSFEGNMGHALLRKPIDVCRHRGEPKVVLGNTAVVRVLSAGPGVRLRPGQRAITFAGSGLDRFGYTTMDGALAYDARGTMGCLATRVLLKERELVALPEDTRHELPRWGAFSGRYLTAWSNWRLAYGTFRLLVPEEDLPAPHVWGWGGGTTFAELDLARRHGCRVAMVSGDGRRLQEIEAAGIAAVDRRPMGELHFDERRYANDRAYRRAYAAAEAAFLREVDARTNGERVQIFVDYIGTPFLRATQKALSREAVLTTAGWKEGMTVSYLRAIECIERHQYIHTHFSRLGDGPPAVAYAEEHGWLPPACDRVYGFDDIPRLCDDFLAGDVGLFPVFSVVRE